MRPFFASVLVPMLTRAAAPEEDDEVEELRLRKPAKDFARCRKLRRAGGDEGEEEAGDEGMETDATDGEEGSDDSDAQNRVGWVDGWQFR